MTIFKIAIRNLRKGFAHSQRCVALYEQAVGVMSARLDPVEALHAE